MSAGPPFLDLASKDGKTWYNTWTRLWGDSIPIAGACSLTIGDSEISLVKQDGYPLIEFKYNVASGGPIYVKSVLFDKTVKDAALLKSYAAASGRTFGGLLNDLLCLAKDKWGTDHFTILDRWEGFIKTGNASGFPVTSSGINSALWKVRREILKTSRIFDPDSVIATDKEEGFTKNDLAIFVSIKTRLGALYDPETAEDELALLFPFARQGYYGLFFDNALLVEPDHGDSFLIGEDSDDGRDDAQSGDSDSSWSGEDHVSDSDEEYSNSYQSSDGDGGVDFQESEEDVLIGERIDYLRALTRYACSGENATVFKAYEQNAQRLIARNDHAFSMMRQSADASQRSLIEALTVTIGKFFDTTGANEQSYLLGYTQSAGADASQEFMDTMAYAHKRFKDDPHAAILFFLSVHKSSIDDKFALRWPDAGMLTQSFADL